MFTKDPISTRDDGEEPAEPVPNDQLKDLPYAAMGHLVRGDGGRGTCWLAGSNVAVTAAHVVIGASKIQVTLPGIDEVSRDVTETIIYPKYSEEKQYDHDIALLRLQGAANRRFLSLTEGPSDGVVQVLGFPDQRPEIFRSSGPAVQPYEYKNFLLHRASTKRGHSGGPVLEPANGADQRVIALHVSGWEANPDKPSYPKHNLAVLLRPELKEFISKYLEQWR
jgi:V8-like Glu-specific endopeptidase